MARLAALAALATPAQGAAPFVTAPVPLATGATRTTVCPHIPVGERFRAFAPAWLSLTDDPWVRRVVQEGLALALTGPVPCMRRVRTTIHPAIVRSSPAQMQSMSDKILAWKQARVISPLGPASALPLSHWPQVICPIFPVPKKNNEVRPVFDARALNNFLVKEHFQMESIADLPHLLRQNDWMVKVDIKDAFQHIAIREDHQKYLGFIWEEQVYMFLTMPFGLSSAPRVFTKMMKPIVAACRSNGMRLIIYMDDLLLMAETEELCKSQLHWMLDLMNRLGLMVNWEKSELAPTRTIGFLGHQVDSASMTISLPSKRMKDLRSVITDLLSQETPTTRVASQVLGKMGASVLAIQTSRLHTRALLRDKLRAWASEPNWDAPCHLSGETRAELRLWLSELESWNGRTLLPVPPEMVLFTDASQKGWGAALTTLSTSSSTGDPPRPHILFQNLQRQQRRTGGSFSEDEAPLHINAKELLGVLFGIRAFLPALRGKAILLRIDNMTAVAHVNHMGGTHSETLSRIAELIWKEALQARMHLRAEHIAGVDNVEADEESRAAPNRHEWMLNRRVFRQVEALWGPFDVDLFASRTNSQLPAYFAWKPDPGCLAVDAMIQPWADLVAYANPPWPILARVLGKIRQEEATVVLIAPLWASRPWFPTLLSLLADVPRILPPWEISFTAPTPDWHLQHPRREDWRLAAWKLSGKRSAHEAFLKRQSRLQGLDSLTRLSRTTSHHGQSLLIGALSGTPIHAVPLEHW